MNPASSQIQIALARPEWIPSFYECRKEVAAEEIHLEMTEPPPLEKVTEFQMKLISRNGPVFYALDASRVVGWCDVFPQENPRMAHRGCLGMGIAASYRGRGIGTRLLASVLDQAGRFGLEKVELCVYTSNLAALALYRKLGFVEEGLIRSYRRLGDREFDAVLMARRV